MKLPLKLSVLVVVFQLIMGGQAGVAAEAAAVELIGRSELQPGSTLEFRFPEPVVGGSQLGPTETPPIEFQPELPGRFTWLSTRSGVFVPEGPLPLGKTWKIAVRTDLKRADGTPESARISATVTTPAFSVTPAFFGAEDFAGLSAEPEIRLAFNADVDLVSAKKAISFVNANGTRIPAHVRFATGNDYFPSDAKTWNQRWAEALNPAAQKSEEDEDDSQAGSSSEEIRSRLVAVPSHPLQPGGLWTLEMAAGVAAADASDGVLPVRSFPLGSVPPLAIESVSAVNFINSGPTLQLRFNSPLAPDITSGTASKFFAVDPPVEKLTFDVDWQQVTIRGNFEVGKSYSVTLDEGVVSSEGTSFVADRKLTVEFRPVLPRIYLPEISAEQMRFGTRQFPVRFINLAGLRLTAKKVPPKDLPEALAAFADYRKTEWDENNPDETFQPVAADRIPGKVIFNKELSKGSFSVDEAGSLVVDWTQILGDGKPGAIFLTLEGTPMKEAGSSRPGAQALIQVTDLGILWKASADGISVRVFSMQTGKALKSAKAVLVDGEFKEISRASTDANGVALLPFSREPAWLTVTAGEDAQAIAMGPNARELPVWAFGVPTAYRSWNSADASPELRGLLFTERPLYRPGETVHVKGIIRRLGAGGLESGAQIAGRLVLYDPRGEEVEAQSVTTDEEGGFDAVLTAPQAKRGEYRIGFKAGSDAFSAWQADARSGFLVADYQPDAFEVSLSTPSDLAAGVALPAPRVSGRYFFGAPISGALVRWTSQSARSDFFPDGFGEFTFLSSGSEGRAIRTESGEGTMKEGAEFPIPVQLPKDPEFPTTHRLTVEVTDANQQTVSTEKVFRRESADFYLGIAPLPSRVLQAGGQVPIRVVAVKPNGAPLMDPVRYDAELFFLRRDVVRVQSAGKGISFQTSTTRVPVAEKSGATVIPRKDGDVWKVDETSDLGFPIADAGAYLLIVTAKDGGGREVRSESEFYVAGPGATVWDYRNASQVDLVPDQPEYQPGQTARLLVKNPIPGEAWVSVEQGGRVLRKFAVKLEGNAPVIEIPIELSDAPNVAVSLVVIQSADASKRKFPAPEFRYGLCNLRVVNPRDALDVKITTPVAKFQPGETVRSTIAVRDTSGNPVSGAAVTFFAVDDGVLALTGYDRPDPLSVFTAPIPLAVRTGLTLESLMSDNPEELVYENKGYLIGGGGFGGPGIKFREDFPGTICWMPNLKTDADGTVQAEFKAPDALTRYRLVAVVSSGITQFGSAESSITIAKPLMLLSGLGAFANVGDTLVARVLIRNQSGFDGIVKLEMGLSGGAEAAGDVSASVTVASGQTTTVDVPVKFSKVGAARVEWSATMQTKDAAVSDALAVAVNVGSPMVTLRETYLPGLNGATTNLLNGINPQLQEGSGSVRVVISNSRLAGIGGAALYLLDYPFGCAEQTSSSMVPWLVEGLNPVLPEVTSRAGERTAALRAKVNRLFSMQTDSGGIAFWPGASEPSLFASAWAAVVTAQLPAEFMASRNSERAALMDFLSRSLRSPIVMSDGEGGVTRALMLYALSLNDKAEPSYCEELLGVSEGLPEEARSLLALAMNMGSGDEAKRAAAGLLEARSTSAEFYSVFGNASREMAIRLLALSKVQPKSDQIPPLVAELLQARQNGHWGNTQADAWALLALQQYALGSEAGLQENTKPVEGTLTFNGASQEFVVGKARPSTEAEFLVSEPGQMKELSVANPAERKLFGQTTFVMVPPLGNQPRQSRGFTVSRSYHEVAADGSLSGTEDLRVGDRVLVTIRVESATASAFVAIDDPLPSVLEAVNPAFSSKVSGANDWISGPADFREMLSDRVRFFADQLPAGAVTYQYLARVRVAGESVAAATKAEAMYRPERFGLGEIQNLKAQAAK